MLISLNKRIAQLGQHYRGKGGGDIAENEVFLVPPPTMQAELNRG